MENESCHTKQETLPSFFEGKDNS